MGNMFCYQCEQTAQGKGCTVVGVCGKDPTTSALQDLLIYIVKGISMYAHPARKLGVKDKEVDTYILKALFITVTNVNFDPEVIQQWIYKGVEIRNKIKDLYYQAGGDKKDFAGPATWQPADSIDGLLEQAKEISIAKRIERQGADVTGLQELLLYGIKGSAAYAHHAEVLGYEDENVYADFHKMIDYLASDPAEINELVQKNLEWGKINLRVMELLDAANTGVYGHPEPTKVRITPVKGKCIVVSGHDLKDLDELLKQTEGLGINIYTHGEMLPCHGYPKLKKYKHLVGNYGGAWQDQQREFDQFPGAILMTTNCIQKPRESYKSRIFTSGVVGWPGVVHISDRNFKPVIDAALSAEGFKEDGEEKYIMVGFARNAVLSVADKIIDMVKNGEIRHFFLIGGCDGARSSRNYYTRLAQMVPDDCLILTLACGKYRFNKLEFGQIKDIPRLLDIGQCNDAYSAIQIALALAKAFDTDVNSLPLSLIISWYEQKAVCILLTLLYLGIKNIKLGPTLPAFVTEPVLKVLVDNFDIAPITTPEEDLKAILH